MTPPPTPRDPIKAARGVLAKSVAISTAKMRELGRKEDALAEAAATTDRR